MSTTSIIQKIVLAGFLALLLGSAYLVYPMIVTHLTLIPQDVPVRIGYSHGERNTILYRTYITRRFEQFGVSVDLITKPSINGQFQVVPKSYDEIKHLRDYGQVDGEELIRGLMRGDWDAITIGEANFVKAVLEEMPLVAVAELGHEQLVTPSQALLFKSNVSIKSSEDIRGKIIINYVSGLSGELFFKEFLSRAGLRQGEVTILKATFNESEGVAQESPADGVYVQTTRLMQQMAMNTSAPSKPLMRVYQRLNDWLDPHLSHTLLVFRKDFIDKHPREVEKVVRAYMTQVQFENTLSDTQRHANPEKGLLHGLQIEADIRGLDLPQADMPPTISFDLLSEVQLLLLKHGYIDAPKDIGAYIDNRFVEKLYKEEFK